MLRGDLASINGGPAASRLRSHSRASTSRPVSHGSGNLPMRSRTSKQVVAAAERDLDWEPDAKPGPLMAPGRNSSMGGGGIPPPPPPPPLPPRNVSWYEWPFVSRRNIALTMLGGSAALWISKHYFGPIRFADKPDIDFRMLGYTDLAAEDFVYFKTQGGHWVAAAEDEQGRLFMIDEIGDLYYDSGDPEIGLYAMDTQGNLYNFYNDTDGERKITPVGSVNDLRQFKVSEIAGVKLDRDVGVVAFQDGRQIPLPPGTGFVDANGKYIPPGELLEGYTRSVDDNPVARLLGRRDAAFAPPERMELDLADPTPFNRQLYDQVLLDDPDLPGLQPALPEDFDLDKLAAEVAKEAKR